MIGGSIWWRYDMVTHPRETMTHIVSHHPSLSCKNIDAQIN
jgi:hypothetical protein